MSLDIKMNLPEAVKYILDTLHNNGYSCYVVGGCVRDAIMGKEPHDYDITTSAKPNKVIEIFNEYEVLPTGLQHGTVTVIIESESFEITTYRLDGKYSDARHPDNIELTDNIIEDLKRRDFTMNAIAYNPWDGFVDPFNGVDDIKNKMIRCVGSPSIRFHEDGLRILRAMRFAAQLGFDIEEQTSLAMRNSKHLLDNISKERIQGEFVKILKSEHCGSGVFEKYLDIVHMIIPEIEHKIDFSSEYEYNLWWRTLRYMDCLGEYGEIDGDDIVLRLAILFYNIETSSDESAKITYKILRDLKFSNEIVAYTTQLVSYLDFADYTLGDIMIKQFLNDIGEKQVRRLILFKKCMHSIILDEYMLNNIIENNECYSLQQLAVNGDDLIEHGIQQGKEVGNVLNSLLRRVFIDNNRNDRELLLQEVDRIATMYKNDN